MFFLTDPPSAPKRHAALLRPFGRLALTTFAGNDPGFEAAMREVGRFVSDALPPRDERQGALSPESIAALLAEAGLSVTPSEESGDVSRFASADHRLSWAWSHGGRHVLERVSQSDLPAASEAAKHKFESTRTSAGDYAITTSVRFTVATRVT